MDKFRTILIGGDSARRVALRIGEFDYLIGQPFSVVGFVNPKAEQRYTLVNCGWDWYDLPIFQDLETALRGDRAQSTEHRVNSVGIYFNAKHVLEWVREIVRYPQVKNVVIFAEDVLEKDAREIVYLADKYELNIIGPSSTGILIAGKGRLGEIAGEFRKLQLCKLDKLGSVGLITKSGTMAGELMWVISQNSPGVSTAVQIGGDAFPATDFVHWLEYFAKDPSTKVVVMSGEAGGDLEERAGQWYGSYVSKKSYGNHFKLVAVISGLFLEQMPKGQKFGHAGAKQEELGFGSARHKIEILREAGVEVVEFEKLGEKLRELSGSGRI